MQKKQLLTILVSGIVLLASSCSKKSKTGPTGPTGPAGPSFKGVINGHVGVYDQYGINLLSGLENITLTMQGGKTVTADKNGYFIFDSVSTGTYKITAGGTSYATTMVPNVGFIKDTLYQHINLSLKPTFNVESFTAMHNAGSTYDSLIITAGADTRARNCIVFVNNKPAVNNQPGNYLISYVKTINPNTGIAVLRIPAWELNSAGIFFGEPVYFAAYSYVVNDASVYEDPATGKNIYNAVGTTVLIDSAICP